MTKKIFLKSLFRKLLLASNNFFTRDVNQYTNMSLSQLYHQEHLFDKTLITSSFHPVNIAKFLRTAFSQNTSTGSRLQMSFKIDILKSFRNFTGKHLCWSLFLKNLQAEGLQLYQKKVSNTGVFL